jgi:muconolactone D-isomerase
MEFLVRQTLRLPVPPPADLDARRLEEREYAMTLREKGVLIRLWRVPGTRNSIGLYAAPDASALHAILSALPMFAWLELQVEPLATHPQEAG